VCVCNNTQQLLMSLVVDASHFFVLLCFYCSLCWVLWKKPYLQTFVITLCTAYCMETARTLHARTYVHCSLSLSSQDNFNREIVISVGQALTDHKLLFLLITFFFTLLSVTPKRKEEELVFLFWKLMNEIPLSSWRTV
jgi:hypothetical protein